MHLLGGDAVHIRATGAALSAGVSLGTYYSPSLKDYLITFFFDNHLLPSLIKTIDH